MWEEEPNGRWQGISFSPLSKMQSGKVHKEHRPRKQDVLPHTGGDSLPISQTCIQGYKVTRTVSCIVNPHFGDHSYNFFSKFYVVILNMQSVPHQPFHHQKASSLTRTDQGDKIKSYMRGKRKQPKKIPNHSKLVSHLQNERHLFPSLRKI